MSNSSRPAETAQPCALISVSDKRGLLPFAQGLHTLGWRILSTGGTLKYLNDNGVPAIQVSDHTGSPEILDGRVKTLHPKIHGGILARRDDASHVAQLDEHGITPLDLVAVNLYPFRETVAKEGVTLEDAVENIDIGGPSMLRSSAKNHGDVTVICNPDDYPVVLAELQASGSTTLQTRRRLAVTAFRHTADYDGAIDAYLSKALLDEQVLRLGFRPGSALRYGENDHQKATFYPEFASAAAGESNLGSAQQLHGKALSYNNLVDADAALEAVRDLQGDAAVAVIKHMNPCGYATGKTLEQAFEAAWQGDPVSAFGSVIAVTRPVDLATAERLKGRFVELLIAPGFEPDALAYLQKKSKDIRLLQVGDSGSLAPAQHRKVYKHILGGMLEQDRDVDLYRTWDAATAVKMPETMRPLAEFTWKACKHVKSNAIVLGYEYAPGGYTLVGMGPGQPNRIDSNLKLAQPRARENLARIAAEQGLSGTEAEAFVQQALARCVLASDAFFPFDDNVLAAHEGGIKHIVQPGGSVRDPEVIATADRLGISLTFTGTRHFRH